MTSVLAGASVAVLFTMLFIGGQQIQSAKAFSYAIAGGDSCLALPQSAKAQWDQRLGKCTVQGTLTLSQQEVLMVGQGVTFAIAVKAIVTNGGTINNSEGATLLNMGRLANNPGATMTNAGLFFSNGKFSNAGSVTNLGNMTLTSHAALVNSGTIINFVQANFKNSGKATNTGSLANYVNATLVNSGRLCNNATISDAGKVENRGTLFSLENSRLVVFKGSTVRNTGNVMQYCNAYVNGTIFVCAAIDRCDDPPAAYDDAASTAQETPVTIDVLSNDEGVETANLTVTLASTPRNGTATINGDMTVTYTPNAGFVGSDSFTYSISDGNGGIASAIVSITVQALPSVPSPVTTPPPTPAPSTGELYCGRDISTFSSMIRGTEGRDTLVGTDRDDLILGLGGDDTIRGKGGNDCIIGGQGDDNIWGGDGNDMLHGGNGDDKVIGDEGNDKLWGGTGDDKLYDDKGDDALDGGDGRDLGFDVVGNNTIVNCERH